MIESNLGTATARIGQAFMENLHELHGREPAEAESIRQALVAELMQLVSRSSLTEKASSEA